MASLAIVHQILKRVSSVGLVVPTLLTPRIVNQRLASTTTKSAGVVKASLVQEIKENDARCEEAMRDGIFIAYHRGSPLLRVEETENSLRYSINHLSFSDLLPHFNNKPEAVIQNGAFLNLTSDMKPQCAVLIPSESESVVAAIEEGSGSKFCNVRLAIYGLPEVDQILVSQGSALLYWLRNFQFCSRCGHKLNRNTAGSQKKCSSCKHVHYTSLSPVIIVLVSDPERTKCLLVRQPKHPGGMYTAIAGYVEIGETLEDAVAREIAEEVGLDVLHQEYVKSQHWPLPMSTLMLGCLATADSNAELTIDKRELQDARWFAAADAQKAFDNVEKIPFYRITDVKKNSPFFVPPKGAVAHDLIKLWLKESAK